MEDKPMTEEEFLENHDLFNATLFAQSDEEAHKLSHLMEAFKDSHTAPILSEIESLKKEVERLNKHPNSEDVKRWFQLLIGKSNDHMEADIAEFYHSNQ